MKELRAGEKGTIAWSSSMLLESDLPKIAKDLGTKKPPRAQTWGACDVPPRTLPRTPQPTLPVIPVNLTGDPADKMAALKTGMDIIDSTAAYWYFDCGQGNWLGW
tara:strand:- start:24 stop:338 length:315 start_codon:yes stop_codon:yes gene_type:complete